MPRNAWVSTITTGSEMDADFLLNALVTSPAETLAGDPRKKQPKNMRKFGAPGQTITEGGATIFFLGVR